MVERYSGRTGAAMLIGTLTMPDPRPCRDGERRSRSSDQWGGKEPKVLTCP
jgi:hypothetical protein